MGGKNVSVENGDEKATPKPRTTKWSTKKKLLIAVGVVVVCLGGVAIGLFVASPSAVNQYLGDVDRQYKAMVQGDGLDEPSVTLRQVWLGNLINPKYRRAQELSEDYQVLIDELRNYTKTMALHNELVDKFNSGINGGEVVNGDLLDLVAQMDEAVKSYYPERTEEIAALDNLYQTVASSSDFTEISGDVNVVLHDDDEWLSEERESIETLRAAFQSSINSI